MAQIIFPIAEQDDRASRWSRLRLLEQFVAAGAVKRIVQRRSTTRPQHAHAFSQLLRVVREILRHFRRRVKPDDHRLVVALAHSLV